MQPQSSNFQLKRITVLLFVHALGVRALPLGAGDPEVGGAPLVNELLGDPQVVGVSLMQAITSATLVLLGGVFSGLSVGLMGLDNLNLRVLASSSPNLQVRQDAETVLSLLSLGRHWVLVCLLLSNVIVNEALPIFLDSLLGGGFLAILLSSGLIVIFGEIIPQAVCARWGLRVGACCSPFVKLLMYIEAPVAWPIAVLLDRLLGVHNGTSYKRKELASLVGFHGDVGGRADEETLNQDEVTIISSVLSLSEVPISSLMTPLLDVFSLSCSDVLDTTKVEEIVQNGYSRIPVWKGHQRDHEFVGMLLVKQLIAYDPTQARLVGSFPLAVLPEAGPDATCFDVLNFFQEGRSHLLLISKTPGVSGGAVGIVCLEDVFEALIGEEIIDETDVFVDVHSKEKVSRQRSPGSPLAWAPFMQGVLGRRRDRPNSGIGTSDSAGSSSFHLPKPSITDFAEGNRLIGRIREQSSPLEGEMGAEDEHAPLIEMHEIDAGFEKREGW